MTQPVLIDHVLRQLALGPDLVIPLIWEVPAEIRKRRPAPGMWSAHENACHLPVVQPIMLARLDDMLASPGAVIKPYEPATDEPDDALLHVDLEEAMTRFRRERTALIERLKQLTPEQWAVTAEHGEYSHYSVFIMFRHLAIHDVFHAYRIEQRLLKKDWE